MLHTWSVSLNNNLVVKIAHDNKLKWLVLNNSLVVKGRLHHTCFTNENNVICHKTETKKHPLRDYKASQNFLDHHNNLNLHKAYPYKYVHRKGTTQWL